MALAATFKRAGSTLQQVRRSNNGRGNVVIYSVYKPRTSLKTYEVARLIKGVYPSQVPAEADNNLKVVNRLSTAITLYNRYVAGQRIVTPNL